MNEWMNEWMNELNEWIKCGEGLNHRPAGWTCRRPPRASCGRRPAWAAGCGPRRGWWCPGWSGRRSGSRNGRGARTADASRSRWRRWPDASRRPSGRHPSASRWCAGGPPRCTTPGRSCPRCGRCRGRSASSGKRWQPSLQQIHRIQSVSFFSVGCSSIRRYAEIGLQTKLDVAIEKRFKRHDQNR